MGSTMRMVSALLDVPCDPFYYTDLGPRFITQMLEPFHYTNLGPRFITLILDPVSLHYWARFITHIVPRFITLTFGPVSLH